MRGEHMGRLFADALPKMRKIISKFEPPFIAQLDANGSLTGPLTEKRIVGLVKDKYGIRI
jgi:hypothetical protein